MNDIEGISTGNDEIIAAGIGIKSLTSLEDLINNYSSSPNGL